MSKKLVLIDGHSILHRAFYGVPDLSIASGMHTNAIYGFLNILFSILDEEKPDYLITAFDAHAKTFRHEMYEAYKGTRKPMPEELRMQVPVMQEVLQSMQIPTISIPGWEADDILGSLAKKAEKDGMDVSLVSGDRDLLQIASDRIKIRLPRTRGNKTEVDDYYAKDVLAEYELDTEGFIEWKALHGDSSDNIPGVPKVGEKTAKELLLAFKSIDGIYENLESISKNAIRESLRENKELAYLCKKLVTIKTDCDIPISWEEATTDGMFNHDAYEMFQKLELKKLLKRFEGANVQSQNADFSSNVEVVDDFSKATTLLDKAKGTARIGIGFDVSEKEELLGIVLTFQEEETYYFEVGGFLTEEYLTNQLQCIGEMKEVWCAQVKEAYRFFTDISSLQFKDCVIAAYLIHPLKSDYDILSVASEYCSAYPTINSSRDKAIVTAKVAWMASQKLNERLDQLGETELFEKIEMPLSKVLFAMEKNGIHADKEALAAYGESLNGGIESLKEKIYQTAGCEFNILSPKQLGEILFEKMGIPGGKKTKTGYSTSADVLEKLAGEYPIVSSVLEYRTLTKLKATYAEGLASCIKEDGKIHTSFNQTITATGRISSTEPNLQNIPMRTELGRQIRKVFVPAEGNVFVDADYSQIELRILAHMSNDVNLIDAYNQAEDIHAITASKVFHVPLGEVTPELRRNAKAVNFGIVYGISSFGLSQDLSISKKEAASYIEQYFETYPGIKEFLDANVSKAKETGQIETMFHRVRPIPELASSNFMQRSFGERVAMNSPIQGTAADIMKIAMINVYHRLQEEVPEAKLLIQVHDELLVETPKEKKELVSLIVKEEMENAVSLKVKLEADVHSGNDWYEAK